ncbi:MAG: NAD-binding protein [Actinobacteria bacterium]|nr:NAD-binding protein [Actinomycetota bacterium]
MEILRRLRLAFLALFIVLTSGILGYAIIEKWSFLDAFYMTIITISTVGFTEIAPLSQAGKILTIFLIVGGVGTGGYTLGTAVEFMIEGHLTGIVERRRIGKILEKLKDHYIICGFGRVGQQIAKEFKSTNNSFVVIDNNPEAIEKCREKKYLYIEGDAADDEVLKSARIKEAKGLITAADSDADNVYITLSAKGLCPNLFVVARSNLEGSEEKLKKAGADRVISPYSIGGRRMAYLIMKPLISDYLDIVTKAENIEFRLEEVAIGKDSPIKNTTIKEANIHDEAGVLILAIEKKEGKLLTNPRATETIHEDDKLVIIGTYEQLEKFYLMIK